MDVGIQLKLSGDKALEKVFRELPDKVRDRVARKAVNAAVTPILKAARRTAPKKTNLLEASLDKRVVVYRRNQVVWGGVGPRSGKAPHAHLTEFGTQERHWKTRDRRSTGRVKAMHWLKKAADEALSASRAAMEQKLRDGIEAEAVKLGRK